MDLPTIRVRRCRLIRIWLGPFPNLPSSLTGSVGLRRREEIIGSGRDPIPAAECLHHESSEMRPFFL